MRPVLLHRLPSTAKGTDAARVTRTGVVGWDPLPSPQELPWTWPPSSLGDCITLPEREAASAAGVSAGGSGETPPQPGEAGEGGFYPLLSVHQRLLLLRTWQLGSHRPG